MKPSPVDQFDQNLDYGSVFEHVGDLNQVALHAAHYVGASRMPWVRLFYFPQDAYGPALAGWRYKGVGQ